MREIGGGGGGGEWEGRDIFISCWNPGRQDKVIPRG